jgi:serine/threonine protein kinase
MVKTKLKKIKLKAKRLKSFKKTNLKGGKLIGEGTFGCVIKPSIPCKKHTKTLNHTVSKIIKDPDFEDIQKENKVNKILSTIDPTNKYYISYIDMCILKSIPTRMDLETIQMINNEHYYTLNNNKKNKYTCKVDVGKDPVNIIMPDGGINLEDIIKKQNKYPIHFNLFIKNFKNHVKHLLLGLKLAHENKIVNRDIKDSNIVCLLSNNELKIRYIDFGLSLYINEKLLTDNNYELNGSPGYYPLDNIIAFYIASHYPDKQTIYKKVKEEINSDKNYIYKLKKLKLINKLINLDTRIDIIYNKLSKLYDNKTFPYEYYGYNDILNGLLQKTDIYSLGITFLTIVKSKLNYNINKLPLFKDLCINMTLTDYTKRYNALQCLEHPYFQSKEKIIM